MSDPTYLVNVPGVGEFVCRRRTVRVGVAIDAEYNRLTEGAETVSPQFHGICAFLSHLWGTILVGPPGWDLYGGDNDKEEVWTRLTKVSDAIMAAEGRFREGPKGEPQAPGASA